MQSQLEQCLRRCRHNAVTLARQPSELQALRSQESLVAPSATIHRVESSASDDLVPCQIGKAMSWYSNGSSRASACGTAFPRAIFVTLGADDDTVSVNVQIQMKHPNV
jgi:hypothetical protein